MFKLILVVCLTAANPGSCREERPGFEGLSAVSCMTQGQMLAARWLADHPALILDRWRCEPPGGRQTRI